MIRPTCLSTTRSVILVENALALGQISLLHDKRFTFYTDWPFVGNLRERYISVLLAVSAVTNECVFAHDV